jgi:hypothetical protein
MNWRRAEAPAGRSTRVPDCFQDLHHGRDHDQRPLGRAGSRPTAAAHWTSAAISCGLTTNVDAAGPLASAPPSVSGTGWAGAIRSGRPSACRWRSPSARQGFRDFLAGAHAMDQHFRTRRWPTTCRCAWACSTSGTATSSVSPAAASRRTTAPCAAFRPICSSWRWRATANAWTCRPAAAVRHLARGVGRAGHQRPACLLPDAAPGHGRGAGGVHRGAQGGP